MLQGIIALLQALFFLLAAGGLTYLCVYYRLSIQTIGWVGVIGVAACVLQLFVWRFHRNVAALLRDAGVLLRMNHFSSLNGYRCMLPLQALVTAGMILLPLLFALLEARFVDVLAGALARSIPFVNKNMLHDLFKLGLTSVSGMYAVEFADDVLTAAGCLLCIPLYRQYRQMHDRPMRW